MRCPKCSKMIPSDLLFCPECGTKVAEPQKETPITYYWVSEKKRMTALILACLGLIGLAGLHRLYVGKKWSATLYFLTLGLFFLGTLYDIYCIFMESFEDKDGYPLYSDASMKSNYKRRQLRLTWSDYGFPIPGLIIIFLIIIRIFAMTNIIYSSFTNTSRSASKTTISSNTKSSTLNKESELRAVAEIKNYYNKGAYFDAEQKFESFKKNFPNSKYIGLLEKDYPDIKQKKQQLEHEMRVREDNRMKSLNESLLSMYGGVVEGVTKSKVTTTKYVWVNNNWYLLSSGAKRQAAENIVQLIHNYGYKDNVSIKVTSTQKEVASWGPILGIEISN